MIEILSIDMALVHGSACGRKLVFDGLVTSTSTSLRCNERISAVRIGAVG
jgi:hypothetical protein